MKTNDFEILHTALTEMESTPQCEGLEVGLGYACDKLSIPVDVEHHKEIMDFYGRHRAKLAAAFREGKPRFLAVCEACAERDTAEAQA